MEKILIELQKAGFTFKMKGDEISDINYKKNNLNYSLYMRDNDETGYQFDRLYKYLSQTRDRNYQDIKGDISQYVYDIVKKSPISASSFIKEYTDLVTSNVNDESYEMDLFKNAYLDCVSERDDVLLFTIPYFEYENAIVSSGKKEINEKLENIANDIGIDEFESLTPISTSIISIKPIATLGIHNSNDKIIDIPQYNYFNKEKRAIAMNENFDIQKDSVLHASYEGYLIEREEQFSSEYYIMHNSEVSHYEFEHNNKEAYTFFEKNKILVNEYKEQTDAELTASLKAFNKKEEGSTKKVSTTLSQK